MLLVDRAEEDEMTRDDIKTWHQRCEEHPEHEGIVTEQMIRDRMQEEIDELRKELEAQQAQIAAYKKRWRQS